MSPSTGGNSWSLLFLRAFFTLLKSLYKHSAFAGEPEFTVVLYTDSRLSENWTNWGFQIASVFSHLERGDSPSHFLSLLECLTGEKVDHSCTPHCLAGWCQLGYSHSLGPQSSHTWGHCGVVGVVWIPPVSLSGQYPTMLGLGLCELVRWRKVSTMTGLCKAS